MNRLVITCCIEIPVTQDTSCALETRLDIHEQVSYYMLYEIPVTQDTSCALETRLDIHEQVSYYMLHRDTSNTRYVMCLRD